ncbi:GGDEF domain-containing protein [Oleidesulfovibrio sp.]|uniref:sensor domain-containing diguanylate cyclase n=1 Tax=Oleidesulfovibrio sp. TaxID=2909707 RepID=UPI003A876889
MGEQCNDDLLNALADGVYFVTPDLKISNWNKSAERISGYAKHEVLGSGCSDNFLRHVDDNGTLLCVEGCPLAATLSDGEPREARVYLHHKLGYRVPVLVRTAALRDEQGQIVGAAEVFSNDGRHIDILREMEVLRKEVLTDPLTEVGNRRFADITLERLEEGMAEGGMPFGVIFADIDHFKVVNDRWGHCTGDVVLKMVAKTLQAALRPFDVACRWGGEEFVMLITNTTERSLVIIAERLRKLVEQSWVQHRGENIQVTISVGAAIADKGELANAVVERADSQMYLSKGAGRNCVFFDGCKVGTLADLTCIGE